MRDGQRPSAPVTGVLFDYGGTLVDYGERQHIGAAFVVTLTELGLDLARPEVQDAVRSTGDAVQREYAAKRSFVHADLFRDRITAAAAALDVHVPGDVLDRFVAEIDRVIIEHLLPKHDAVATLRALRDRGLYRGVVSNADDSWLGPAIRRHGFDAVLDHWTSSEEADSCKPDPLIFAHALAKAGLETHQVLHVGDSLHHDVAGASAAGIRTVHVTGGGPAPLSDGLDASAAPDFEIAELHELLDIVDELNGRR